MKTLFIFIDPKRKVKDRTAYNQNSLYDGSTSLESEQKQGVFYFPYISSIIFQHSQQHEKTKYQEPTGNKPDWK